MVPTRMTANGQSAQLASGRERIAIVRGLRTPFAKRGTAYADVSALELAKLVVTELLARAELDAREIDLVVYGQVTPSIEAPNIAREIVLGTDMPKNIEAFSVSRACATGFQAMTSAAEAMLAGHGSVAVAGGADSASDVPVLVRKRLARALAEATKAKRLPDKLAALSKISPRTFSR